MFSRPLTLATAASWWLGAGAFLIPVGVNIANNDLSGAPFSLATTTERNTQVVTIPCSECAFAAPQETIKDASGEDEHGLWIQGGAKNVVFNVTVSGSSLQIGGATVFRSTTSSDSVSASYDAPVVHQVPAGASPDDVASGRFQSVPLSVTDTTIDTILVNGVANSQDVLVMVHYQILTLESQPVELDSVEISVVQTKNNGLMILDIHTQPPAPGMPRPPMQGTHRPARCGILPDPICRLVHGIQSKFYGNRPNGKGCQDKYGVHSVEQTEARPDRFDESRRPGSRHGHYRGMHPHAGPHHHRHHGGRFRHGFLAAFFRGFVAALIPITLGVFVGMTASLVGLGVGRLIGYLWFNLARGGRRGYSSVALDDAPRHVTGDGSDEDETDLPPKYEYDAAYSSCEKGTLGP